MNVLSFGSKKYVFLAQLYAHLKKHDPGLSVDCISLKDRTGKKINEQPVFDDMIKLRLSAGSLLYFFAALPRMFHGLAASAAMLVLAPRQGIHSFGFVLGNFFKISLLQHALRKYSIIHVHYCTARNMTGICFLPKGTPVVCTYWGSDLFRHQGVAYNYWSRRALRRAEVITVSSPEMREAVLSEFGRDLKPKIEYALFIPEFRLIRLIDEARILDDRIAEFKKRLGLAEGQKLVCIGNSAISGNNHLTMLSELEKHAAEFLSAFFVLPMTYGRKEPYCRAVEEFCSKTSLQTCLLREYMSWEDLALLRLASDVMIMMPDSDAMSGALTEAMYSGSVAITGSWLPYGRFRSTGCTFETADEFEELPGKLKEILCDFDRFRQQAAGNRDALAKLYYDEPGLARAWLDAYKKACAVQR